MERRKRSELSADELSQMMIEAQKATYADALDPNLLHPYMWAVKGHYYRPDQAFYNFPYAFGMLFGLGLFRLFEKEGPEFAKRYDELLRMTGKASAVEVTRSAGFDIESEDFWREGIDYLGSRVAEFEELANK
jgi:oligoendopeptidase F